MNQAISQLVIVRGAGEMATGVIHRLHRAGFQVVAVELKHPICVRQLVCFATAIFENSIEIEGVTAEAVHSPDQISDVTKRGRVPVLVDPEGKYAAESKALAVIDARMLKQASERSDQSASILIGLGPGFRTGLNCDAVIETNRGASLGRPIYNGAAEPDTGLPSPVMGYTRERLLRAPGDGRFQSAARIGDMVITGDIIGSVNDVSIQVEIGGVVRGLIRDGIIIAAKQKIGDIDPSGDRSLCSAISDKATAIGKGTLEALNYLR